MADEVEIKVSVDGADAVEGLDEIDNAINSTKGNAEELGEAFEGVSVDGLRDGLNQLGEALGFSNEQVNMIIESLKALESMGASGTALGLVGVLLVEVTALWNEHAKAIKDAEKAFDDYVKKYPNSPLAREAQATAAVIEHGQLEGAGESERQRRDREFKAGRAALGLPTEENFAAGNVQSWLSGYSSYGAQRAETEAAGREAIAGRAAEQQGERDMAERQRLKAIADAKAKAAAEADMAGIDADMQIDEQRRLRQTRERQIIIDRNQKAEDDKAMREGRKFLDDKEKAELEEEEAARGFAKRYLKERDVEQKATDKYDKEETRWERDQEMRAIRNQEKQTFLAVESGYSSAYDRIAKGASATGKSPEQIEKESNDLKKEWHEESLRKLQDIIDASKTKQAGMLAAP